MVQGGGLRPQRRGMSAKEGIRLRTEETELKSTELNYTISYRLFTETPVRRGGGTRGRKYVKKWSPTWAEWSYLNMNKKRGRRTDRRGGEYSRWGVVVEDVDTASRLFDISTYERDRG